MKNALLKSGSLYKYANCYTLFDVEDVLIIAAIGCTFLLLCVSM